MKQTIVHVNGQVSRHVVLQTQCKALMLQCVESTVVCERMQGTSGVNMCIKLVYLPIQSAMLKIPPNESRSKKNTCV